MDPVRGSCATRATYIHLRRLPTAGEGARNRLPTDSHRRFYALHLSRGGKIGWVTSFMTHRSTLDSNKRVRASIFFFDFSIPPSLFLPSPRSYRSNRRKRSLSLSLIYTPLRVIPFSPSFSIACIYSFGEPVITNFLFAGWNICGWTNGEPLPVYEMFNNEYRVVYS